MEIPIVEFYDDEPYITQAKLANSSHPHLKERKDRLMKLNIKTAIITWLDKESEYVNEILKDSELIHTVYGKTSGRIPVYIHEGYLLVFANIGSPMAAGIIEELGYYGIQNFIAYGTAGCIDKNFDTETMLVVERAIRDEGTSYHYLPPSLYIETDVIITNAIEQVLIRHSIKYEKGTTWTTDALYRETIKRTSKRLEQGAVSVEMECAGFAAAAKRMGLRFGQFLFFSDRICVNNGWKWLQESASSGDMKAKLIPLGIEIAKELEDK